MMIENLYQGSYCAKEAQLFSHFLTFFCQNCNCELENWTQIGYGNTWKNVNPIISPKIESSKCGVLHEQS